MVQRVVRANKAPIAVEEVDISSSHDLEARYGLEIPVLLVDGKKVAKYRIDEHALQRIVDEKAGRTR